MMSAKSRSAKRGSTRGRLRSATCPCGATFRYRFNAAKPPLGCPSCADIFVVFDRDRGIGSLPPNLAARYGVTA